MGKTTLLFEAHVLKTPLRDEANEKAFGSSLGKNIIDGASKDFGTSTNPYGAINGAVMNAIFGVMVAGITKDEQLVCEYQTEESVHCVLYAPKSGELKALVINNITKKTSTYTLSKTKLNGEALFAAIIAHSYYFQENSEFVKLYDQLMNLRADNYTDPTAASKIAARLCDNIKCRIERSSAVGASALHIENLESSNVSALTKREIKDAEISIIYTEGGSFRFFGERGTAGGLLKFKQPKDLQNEFAMKGRILSTEEKKLVPTIGDDYQIPRELPMICAHICKTTGSSLPMRNFLIRGESGTGKTELSRAVAYARAQPYVYLTCSASDEVYNFIGQMLPAVEDSTSGKKYSFEQLITSGDFDRFLTENTLPTYMDIYCDAEDAYRKLTGAKKENATENECVVILAHKLMGLIESENGKDTADNGQRFQYVETDFIRAIRNGWVVEIQECGVILQPGVLVGLNGLLDQTASIRLANGEMVRRHPDTIVVLTTNSTYEGCRPLNQSVLSRMSLILDMTELNAEQMQERAAKRTGFADMDTLKLMVEVVQSIRKHCREKSIDDGVCGMRELMAWIQSYQITDDLIESARFTIISTATADAEYQEELLSACVKPYIAE